MAAEPEKFHVGMIDFFSIILPGAILAFHLRAMVQQGKIPAILTAPQSDVEGWVVFAIASYVLGHFLFLVGSWIDGGYDVLREKFAPLEKNFPLKTAIEIKKTHFPPERFHDQAINTVQWTKCRLALAHPAALAHVERFEADSKFFRSLFVVLLILFVSFTVTCRGWFGLACLLLAAASLFRYGEQRFKSTRQAYWYLITLESEKENLRPL